MKEVRFRKVRVGILIDIKCDCGVTIQSKNSGTTIPWRHKVRLSGNDKELGMSNSVKVSCGGCDKQYLITPHVDHVHVEDAD